MRYIALLAINKLLPSHPHLIASYSNVILKSIDDSDSSIRSRALDLVEGMVDRENLGQIVNKLLSQLTGETTAQAAGQHLSSPAAAALSSIATANSSGSASTNSSPSISSPAYKASLISRIVRILQQYNYGNVTDFEWLVDLLIELAYISTTLPNASASLQRQVGDVLVDVSARAKAIRPYAVSKCLRVLPDKVLEQSAAWIVGEYCSEGEWSAAIDTLAEAGHAHSALKVLAKWAAEVGEAWPDEEGCEAVRAQATKLQESNEAHEAHELLALLTMMLANLQPPSESSQPPVGLSILSSLYMPALNPVNSQAQSLVGVPEGLDLDAWIVPGSIVNLPQVSSQDDEVDEYGRPRGAFAPLSQMQQDVLREGRPEKKSKKSKGKERTESEERRHKEVCSWRPHPFLVHDCD